MASSLHLYVKLKQSLSSGIGHEEGPSPTAVVQLTKAEEHRVQAHLVDVDVERADEVGHRTGRHHRRPAVVQRHGKEQRIIAAHHEEKEGDEGGAAGDGQPNQRQQVVAGRVEHYGAQGIGRQQGQRLDGRRAEGAPVDGRHEVGVVVEEGQQPVGEGEQPLGQAEEDRRRGEDAGEEAGAAAAEGGQGRGGGGGGCCCCCCLAIRCWAGVEGRLETGVHKVEQQADGAQEGDEEGAKGERAQVVSNHSYLKAICTECRLMNCGRPLLACFLLFGERLEKVEEPLVAEEAEELTEQQRGAAERTAQLTVAIFIHNCTLITTTTTSSSHLVTGKGGHTLNESLIQVGGPSGGKERQGDGHPQGGGSQLKEKEYDQKAKGGQGGARLLDQANGQVDAVGEEGGATKEEQKEHRTGHRHHQPEGGGAEEAAGKTGAVLRGAEVDEVGGDADQGYQTGPDDWSGVENQLPRQDQVFEQIAGKEAHHEEAVQAAVKRGEGVEGQVNKGEVRKGLTSCECTHSVTCSAVFSVSAAMPDTLSCITSFCISSTAFSSSVKRITLGMHRLRTVDTEKKV
ncbi:hypothetical protein TYRP_002500 [Tyrophagus putrescentiae]|nr:hypothetical protein TYRP_002500 [Tyrophagus putrescentiae]